MSTYHNQAIAYRPEIDGLRAVAVLPVILFHAGFDLFSGGYVGVDVFFVISGYLITSIILREMEQGKFSIARFYERRARRILPALFFVIVCCLPFAVIWMASGEIKRFGQAMIAVSLFASNVFFWKTTNYFAPAAEEEPLLHTWSLAVEEQYYVLFPLFLMLCWRFGRSRLFWLTALAALLSLGLAEWGWRNQPVANFYLLPTRAWELLAGSLLAFFPSNFPLTKEPDVFRKLPRSWAFWQLCTPFLLRYFGAVSKCLCDRTRCWGVPDYCFQLWGKHRRALVVQPIIRFHRPDILQCLFMASADIGFPSAKGH